MTFITREGDAPFPAKSFSPPISASCVRWPRQRATVRQARKPEAQVANDAKSIFLGNMSHELMTPLNAIGGYVALIEMGLRGPVSAEQLVDFARIRHNQAHLLTLISEMLTFVRSERRMEYGSAKSAYEALREVAGCFATPSMSGNSRSSSRLTMDAAGGSKPRAQILLNLVTNAVKYASSKDGQITLSVGTTSRDVTIHVVDTGPGIHEKLSAIFDPFVQLASGLSDRGAEWVGARDQSRPRSSDERRSHGREHGGVGSRFWCGCLARRTGRAVMNQSSRSFPQLGPVLTGRFTIRIRGQLTRALVHALQRRAHGFRGPLHDAVRDAIRELQAEGLNDEAILQFFGGLVADAGRACGADRPSLMSGESAWVPVRARLLGFVETELGVPTLSPVCAMGTQDHSS
jgi:two-component sensor histidine kinase